MVKKNSLGAPTTLGINDVFHPTLCSGLKVLTIFTSTKSATIA